MNGKGRERRELPTVHRTSVSSAGLNLQAANTVIHVDLEWNPTVLEQRLGRARRNGLGNPVQVFVLITPDTTEENLLGAHPVSAARMGGERGKETRNPRR